MKCICDRGLNWFQIYDYKGDVRLCSWLENGYIGNLLKNNVHEIYHGELAQKIRSRLINGDYSMCKVDACPYLAMNEIDKHLVEIDDVPEYPTELYLGFERVCNYDCRCCGIHKTMLKEKDEHLEMYYSEMEEKIIPLLPHIKKISANGCGELFCSKHILNILSKWKPLAAQDEIEVVLESNGSLFNEKNWKKIENLGKYNLRVEISVMSFDEAIYQYLSGCSLPITQIENNLKFISSLRKEGIINFFEIATVVQEQNFRLLPEFVKKCIEEYAPDYIRLRPYESWGAQSQEEAWITDIRNPDHPYYNEYKKVMANPILKHPLVHDWSGGLDTVKKIPFPYKVDNMKLSIKLEMYENFEKISDNILTYAEKKTVVVYGIGTVGQTLVDRLIENGYAVPYILDKHLSGQNYKGIPVYNTVDKNKVDKDLLVIVTPIINDQCILEELEKNGYPKRVSIKQIVVDRELKSELEKI